ncbi:deoxynucleotide monophosphate kinase [Pseudomonas svalbardensis]|uniref:deoxynucleotide monophosphate kinase family protein n=1 Tax=Pseudomonas svalbardensis TaxID=3042029 RepID=UPI0024B33983|nr:deoxynucleotide monophosphate kinase [Pseudomonas sp. PMCC200367]
MRTIIGLAALARSGKDTVASMLLTYPNVAAFALADPLKVGCQALFGLTNKETWDDDLKEKPIDLWSKSPREFFQTVGTEWMRHHNPEHWLMRAEREINRSPETPDIPFPANLTSPEAPFALAAQAFFDFTDDQVWNPVSLDVCDSQWALSPREAIELLKSHTYAMFPDFDTRRQHRPVVVPQCRIELPKEAHTIIIKDIRFENEAAFLRSHNGKIWHIKRPDLQKVNEHSSEAGIEQAPEDVLILNDGSLDHLSQLIQQAWNGLPARCTDDLATTATQGAPDAPKLQGAPEA